MSKMYEADISVEEAQQILDYARQFYELTKTYINELIKNQKSEE